MKYGDPEFLAALATVQQELADLLEVVQAVRGDRWDDLAVAIPRRLLDSMVGDVTIVLHYVADFVPDDAP